MSRLSLLACALLLSAAVHAQLDPLTLPVPRPASKGQYQYGVEMLKLDQAWMLTRGRAPIAIVDGGLMPPHEELGSSLDGNLRLHLSEDMTDPNRPTSYHALMVAGAIVGRGLNGKGVTGSCPSCSASMHNSDFCPAVKPRSASRSRGRCSRRRRRLAAGDAGAG